MHPTLATALGAIAGTAVALAALAAAAHRWAYRTCPCGTCGR